MGTAKQDVKTAVATLPRHSEAFMRDAVRLVTEEGYPFAAVARACKKAVRPLWKPNQLRHVAGTKVRQLFGIEAAQVMLGHSRAVVTQIYAERDWDKAVDEAKAIGYTYSVDTFARMIRRDRRDIINNDMGFFNDPAAVRRSTRPRLPRASPPCKFNVTVMAATWTSGTARCSCRRSCVTRWRRCWRANTCSFRAPTR